MFDQGVPEMRLRMNYGEYKDKRFGECTGYTEFRLDGKPMPLKQFRPRKNELYINSDDINIEEIINFLDDNHIIHSTRISYAMGIMIQSDVFHNDIAGPYFALSFAKTKHAVLFRLFFG